MSRNPVSVPMLPREQWDAVFIPVPCVRHQDAKIYVPVDFDAATGRLGRLLVIPESECRYRSADERWCVRASLLYDDITRWLHRLQQEGYAIRFVGLWPWTLTVEHGRLTEGGFSHLCWQFASAH